MNRPRAPQLVSDLRGGEYVQIAAGPFRISHRSYGSSRWAIPLRPVDLTEASDGMWLAGCTPVLEVLTGPTREPTAAGESVDPLRGSHGR